jgi:hypothetical protein
LENRVQFSSNISLKKYEAVVSRYDLMRRVVEDECRHYDFRDVDLGWRNVVNKR